MSESLRVRLTAEFWVHEQGLLEAYVERTFEEAGEPVSYLSLEDSVVEAVLAPAIPYGGFLDIGIEMINADARIVGGKTG